MVLWIQWWRMVRQLRPAFARETTFLWFALCLVGLTVRPDLRGVTSIIRALGLKEVFYDRLLDFFHSKAVLVDPLAALWCRLILTVLPASLVPKVNDRPVFIGDGIKLAKTGRKMPAVKKLHQESANNTKPEFIYGHSCQAIALLVGCAQSFFALPLTCRIHEGIVFSNRQTKSLLDKMVDLVRSLTIPMPFYLVLDAYYASKVMVHGLLHSGNHLITHVRKNAVAYWPALPNSEKRRGPKRKYGPKVKLKTLFQDVSSFIEAPSPAYGETHVTIRYRPIDLLWRPVGILVRFVLVIHPQHGSKIFMTTDLSLSPAGHPSNLWVPIQNRSRLQASPLYPRNLCLSLLDGQHDASSQSIGRSIPAPKKRKPTEITFAEKCGPIIVTCNWASLLKAYCSTSL